MQTVKLRANVSLIEVMRRFRRSKDSRIIRAYSRLSPDASQDHWYLQFIGPKPALSELEVG